MSRAPVPLSGQGWWGQKVAESSGLLAGWTRGGHQTLCPLWLEGATCCLGLRDHEEPRSRAACRAWLAGGAEDYRRRGSPQVTSAARRRPPIRQVLLYLGAPDSPLPASPLPGGSAVRSPSRAAGRPRAGPPQEVLGRRRTEGHRRAAQPAHVAELPRPRTPGRGPPRHGPVCPLQDPRCPRSEERSLDQELGPWGLSPTP